MSGSGIRWAICKSAPCSRQTTTPAPHHSVFTGRMPFLPPNQQRQSTEGTNTNITKSTFFFLNIVILNYRKRQTSFKITQSFSFRLLQLTGWVIITQFTQREYTTTMEWSTSGVELTIVDLPHCNLPLQTYPYNVTLTSNVLSGRRCDYLYQQV